MAVGLAVADANSFVDAYVRAGTYTGPAAYWIKLHIGDPGASGVNNPAANTTRQQATFGAVSSGGQNQNTVIIQWVAVAANETYTHFSVWDANAAGTFHGSGTVTPNVPVLAGDTFQVNVSGLTVSITVAA